VKVLVNSDVAWTSARSALAPELAALAHVCRDRKHEIALPLTTVLEFERQQTLLVGQERKALRAAAAALDSYGLAHAEVDADALVTTRSLDDLLRETGATVEVISPTLEDFNDAHRRACLHLSPQPTPPSDKKQAEDEMRDLVIWSTSIRVARDQGGALLLSRDKIHTGDLGEEEARGVRLTIFDSVEDVLRFFSIETPDAKLFIEMLTPVWSQLPALGVAVPPDVSVSDVRNARFVRGPSGPSFAIASVRVPTETGERTVVIQLQPGGDPPIRLFNPGEDIPAQPSVRTTAREDDTEYQAKLERLKNLLGG
jgi:hypothetical protein